MSRYRGRQYRNQTPIWIGILIVAVLVVISFINPYFFIDDLIYYGLIILVSISCFCCGNTENNMNVAFGRHGLFKTKRAQWCEACKSPVPNGYTVGDKCPYCGAYFGLKKTRYKIFGIDVGESVSSPGEDPVERVFEPRHRKRGWFGSLKRPEEKRIIEVPKDTQYSDVDPNESPFDPPFDELFKDQSTLDEVTNDYINWKAVHVAVRQWVNEILTSEGNVTDEERLDAWAKWEAWKRFEYTLFKDPKTLPKLYEEELKNGEKMKKKAQDMEKNIPICPECGSSGRNIIKSSLLNLKEGNQEYMCKNCGMIFY
ncbi:MAG: hypothetical protein ACTSUE_27000 [Promethearchaeota archaeon]